MANGGDDHGHGDELLQVDTRRSAGVGTGAVVTVVGELDDVNAPWVQPAIEQDLAGLDGVELLVLDLTGLRFLGSAGLRVLLDVADLTAERGLGFRVAVGTNRCVLRMLDTTGLDQVLPLCGSVEDALSRPARAEDAAPEARSTRR